MDVTIAQPAEAGFSPERLGRIRPLMQEFAARHGFAGISILVARRGRVAYFDQVGWQDREHGIPLAPDTIYRIYSMTKPIVCAAFMALFEEGRFLLSDPLSRYIPAFGRVKVLAGTNGAGTAESGLREEELRRPITLHHLLTHTAGLTYDFMTDNPVAGMYRRARIMDDASRSLEVCINDLARLPLAFQPGTRWHYSLAIDVIGHLVELISGRPLQEFLRRRILEPLGMADTGFMVAPGERPRISAMYGAPAPAGAPSVPPAGQAEPDTAVSKRLKVDVPYPADDPGWARGGHGLFSTAPDYLRFAQMQLNRGELDGARILAPKTVDFMHMNHLPAALLPYELGGTPADGYGFGLGSRVLLNVAESGCSGSVGEFGWSGAAKTHYWVDPQEGLICVSMAQYLGAQEPPNRLLRSVVYGSLVD